MHPESIMRWIAICTSVAAQPRICVALQNCGHEVFLPMESFWKCFRAGKKLKAFDPVFPNYIFVRIEPVRLGEIMDIEGVREVLRSVEGKPVAIADDIIEALRSAVAKRIFDRTRNYGLAAGTDVRIVDGPFAGFVAKVKSASPKQRARLLMEFLGQVVEAEVPVDKLQKMVG
jgi:transcriptional antiterminator RfaH